MYYIINENYRFWNSKIGIFVKTINDATLFNSEEKAEQEKKYINSNKLRDKSVIIINESDLFDDETIKQLNS